MTNLRWLICLTLGFAPCCFATAEEYLLRMEYVEVKYDENAAGDDLFREMTVRPIEFVVGHGVEFDHREVLDGKTIQIQGTLDGRQNDDLQLTNVHCECVGASSSFSANRRVSLDRLTMPSWCLGATTSADGRYEQDFRGSFEVAWKLPLAEEELNERRRALDDVRASLIRRQITKQRRDRLANERAREALFKLAKQLRADGDARGAKYLLATLGRNFSDNPFEVEVIKLSDEIDRELEAEDRR